MRRNALAFLLTTVFYVGIAAQSAPPLDLAHATIADPNLAFSSSRLTAEKLTAMYLARIDAYDKQGPAINAVITLNPNALREARALDAERKSGRVRGPLHGIPIVLKDNFNTSDLPTTGGSQLLEVPIGCACLPDGKPTSRASQACIGRAPGFRSARRSRWW